MEGCECECAGDGVVRPVLFSGGAVPEVGFAVVAATTTVGGVGVQVGVAV